MASSPDTVELTIAGQQIKMRASAEERPHLERAAKRVSEEIHKLQDSATGASPVRIATMAALRIAFELSVADQDLDQAEKLQEELKRQKEAIGRLEGLLARVDEALAY